MESSQTKAVPIPAVNLRERRSDPWWALVIAIVVLTVVLILLVPNPFARIFNFVRQGILTTIYITLISFFLVLVLGLFTGLGRLSRNRVISLIAGVYVEVIRGIPVLVQLMFWFFAFSALIRSLGARLGIQWMASFVPDPVGMASFSLVFCYAAYMGEVYRAGIQSIPKGQMEAARSLGMNYVQAMRYVVLPQAIRVILPPVGNEFITLLKDTSLVSVVGVPDLTREGRLFMASTFIATDTWIMVALLYLIMTLFSARLVSWIEARSKLER